MTSELTRKEFLRTVATVGSAAVVGTACGTTASASTGGLAAGGGSTLKLTKSQFYVRWPASFAMCVLRSRVNCSTGEHISPAENEVQMFDLMAEYCAKYNSDVEPDRFGELLTFTGKASGKPLSDILKMSIPSALNDRLLCALMGVKAVDDYATMSPNDCAQRLAKLCDYWDREQVGPDRRRTWSTFTAQSVVAAFTENPFEARKYRQLLEGYLNSKPKAFQQTAQESVMKFLLDADRSIASDPRSDAFEAGTVVAQSAAIYDDARPYAVSYSHNFPGCSGINAVCASGDAQLQYTALARYDRKGQGM